MYLIYLVHFFYRSFCFFYGRGCGFLFEMLNVFIVFAIQIPEIVSYIVVTGQ